MQLRYKGHRAAVVYGGSGDGTADSVAWKGIVGKPALKPNPSAASGEKTEGPSAGAARKPS